ncbi:MAG: nucleotidyl transferase AbiEii/AbiGii toxin family protein [Candidatus Melainabacteria bacterium]|nr:nucleotidyl transferase AbiEii/AbiGii toxin family protein [Candidatus Melainabacteria bacterium]
MADEFLKLSKEDQREVIIAAAPDLKLLPAVVEKDVWVCFTLNILFAIPKHRPMVFKGGTSLSKVFNLIERFSEDIDISVNFLKDYGDSITKTQASKYRDDIEANLQAYKADVLFPELSERSKVHDLTVEPGDTDWEIHLTYKSVLASAEDYIKSRVKFELSGRNETEPSEQHTVKPYLAEMAKGLVFPEATIDALLAERTFWEKVTLIHAGLHSSNIENTPARMSRHWSDLSALLRTETGERAINDHDLCLRVVNHKDAFWRDGKARYDDCRNKKFRLVPTGDTLTKLKDDYEAMLEAGMFFSERPATFDEIMKDIAAIESRLNSK